MTCLLAADVGGTHTRLAIAPAGPALAIRVQRVYPSRYFSGLEAVVADFLARPEVAEDADRIGAACFSVAGPVADNAVTLTNLGWKVDGAALARSFNLPAVELINDFTAAGRGIALLGHADIEAAAGSGDDEP